MWGKKSRCHRSPYVCPFNPFRYSRQFQTTPPVPSSKATPPPPTHPLHCLGPFIPTPPLPRLRACVVCSSVRDGVLCVSRDYHHYASFMDSNPEVMSQDAIARAVHEIWWRHIWWHLAMPKKKSTMRIWPFPCHLTRVGPRGTCNRVMKKLFTSCVLGSTFAWMKHTGRPCVNVAVADLLWDT